jgi:trans-aconitate 2-methyltransferase
MEPLRDLLKLVIRREGIDVIDLGCGTGEISEKLAKKLPRSSVVGIDSSPEMLQIARGRERPGLSFKLCSLDEIEGQWDLIFSNAALHWVDNHHELVAKLFSHLRIGGQLVVQIPSNHRDTTRTLLYAVAEYEPFKKALKRRVRTSPVLSINEYAELLFIHGGIDIVAYEKVYPHILEDVDAVIDWMRGSVLIPYLDRLRKELHESFIAAYRKRLLEKWPKGPIFFPYRRILFAATRH